MEARPADVGGERIVLIENKGKVPRDVILRKMILRHMGIPGDVGDVPVCSGGSPDNPIMRSAGQG